MKTKNSGSTRGASASSQPRDAQGRFTSKSSSNSGRSKSSSTRNSSTSSRSTRSTKK